VEEAPRAAVSSSVGRLVQLRPVVSNSVALVVEYSGLSLQQEPSTQVRLVRRQRHRRRRCRPLGARRRAPRRSDSAAVHQLQRRRPSLGSQTQALVGALASRWSQRRAPWGEEEEEEEEEEHQVVGPGSNLGAARQRDRSKVCPLSAVDPVSRQ